MSTSSSVAVRWQNQQEAFEFALDHPAVMLNMDMGTGKTRVAIDTVFARPDCRTVLVVCPKAVIPVWHTNLERFYPDGGWLCFDPTKGSMKSKESRLVEWWCAKSNGEKRFVVLNYDVVWRTPLGDTVKKLRFDCMILDESHRAKGAGTKVSKYLAMIGKKAKYKMCLSGTPMANSPLDIYGQYRFLDPTIFGTNHDRFLQQYAVMGGPERRFIVGFKNQQELNEKFKSIAYTCKMSDVADRLKLPPELPAQTITVELPRANYTAMRALNDEFIAICKIGGVDKYITANNVLVKMLRLQQITSGFALAVDAPLGEAETHELNTSKADALAGMLEDVNVKASPLVVFCVFRWDLAAVSRVAAKTGTPCYELSGSVNQLAEWQENGGILAVQIQAGAEGIDMTKADRAVYYSLPHSLALYNQSKARLYRPGQTRPVHFVHLIAENTVDESIYKSLQNKQDVIESIKAGTFDFGYM